MSTYPIPRPASGVPRPDEADEGATSQTGLPYTGSDRPTLHRPPPTRVGSGPTAGTYPLGGIYSGLTAGTHPLGKNPSTEKIQ
ncbi:hypothetical protein BKA56DRAFT_569387 [Ilyonectria sp. MPI-CAGE-AT-0026]|nr:hypothetical protein BKA56DRAFT_569381 [Ilyonectria sp. MPI-CAGE-AT-0026]KAH6995443.1 hypothetical protein BKA56DRAFT_569387 [Ilyonectria sp. MPI-CAGE-AT-0026]